MRRIRITNPVLDHTYKSYLGADYAVADGTAVTLLSNNSFAADDLLVFGEPREELTELKKLASVSGATSGVLASALKFAHQKNDPIYKSLWDQVHIEANTGSGFAVISESAIQWDNKDGETIYFHSAGTNSTSYRFRFYNTVTATYSEYSPTLTGALPSRNSVGYMLTQIRIIAGDKEKKIVSDEELIRVLNRGQDIIYAHNPRYWFLYVDTEKEDDDVAAVADTAVYSLADYDNLGHLARIKYRYTSGSTDQKYDLEYKSPPEFDALDWDYNRTGDDFVRFYTDLPVDDDSDKGYFKVFPFPANNSIGKFYPCYYEKMADLDTVDDETQIPIPAILEDYGISYVFSVKGNETMAGKYMDQFMGPPDNQEDNQPLTGIKLLDQIDKNRQKGRAYGRSLSVYKGRLGAKPWRGPYRGYNHDYLKEKFF